jgi:hypothetical protein
MCLPETNLKLIIFLSYRPNSNSMSAPIVAPSSTAVSDPKLASAHKSLSSGAIAGIVIGVLLFAALVAVAIALLLKERRRGQEVDPPRESVKEYGHPAPRAMEPPPGYN